MFDIGSLELFLVLIVALLVIGPQRLPEVARMLGSTLRRVRHFTNRLREETQIDEQLAQLKNTVGLEEHIEDFKKETHTFTEKLNREVDTVRSSIAEHSSVKKEGDNKNAEVSNQPTIPALENPTVNKAP